MSTPFGNDSWSLLDKPLAAVECPITYICQPSLHHLVPNSFRPAVLNNVLPQGPVTPRIKVVKKVAGIDTASLVNSAQEGDRDAFASLTRTYLRPAYLVALAILGRPSDAEDIAQDSFLIAFERLGTCREPKHFSGWLLQIVRNRARNAMWSRKLRDVPSQETSQEPSSELPSPDSSVNRSRLAQALSTLTVIRREVVLLHDLEGWTHSEIAEVLRISELMSRQHLFVARRQLRDQLNGKMAEVEHG